MRMNRSLFGVFALTLLAYACGSSATSPSASVATPVVLHSYPNQSFGPGSSSPPTSINLTTAPQTGVLKASTRNLNPANGVLVYYIFASAADAAPCLNQKQCSAAMFGPVAAVNGEVTFGRVSTTNLYFAASNTGVTIVTAENIDVTITASQ